MMRNRLFRDNDIFREAQAKLNEWLPNSWLVDQRKKARIASRIADRVIYIKTPDGSKAKLVIEVKKSLDPKDVESAVNKIKRNAPRNTIAVIGAPFLGARTQEKLRNRGAGYIDLTGNAYLRLERPALLIDHSGASKNPWRTERPVRSLKGPKAARLVRALIDFYPPRGVRELAQIADIDAGYTSRLLGFLQREDLITRSQRGPIEKVEWLELLRTWVRDYSLTESNAVHPYLQPRGLKFFLDGLRELTKRIEPGYALTGSLAAARLSPVAPARLGVCYTDNAFELSEQLKLVPAETGANILLIEPFNSIVFERTTSDAGLVYVAPSQVAADLLSGTGRMPEEGEALINWMKTNEEKWRAK